MFFILIRGRVRRAMASDPSSRCNTSSFNSMTSPVQRRAPQCRYDYPGGGDGMSVGVIAPGDQRQVGRDASGLICIAGSLV